MAQITRLGPGAYPSRLYGSFAGRTVSTTLQVCHETRKAFEGVVSGLATVSVAWPGRPFTLPNAVFWRVAPIRWRFHAPYTLGSGSRLGRVGGELVLEVWRPDSQGMGTLNTHADTIRDGFTRLVLAVPSGMEARCGACSGPVPVSQPGYAGVRISIPFEVVETITS